jgi:hypothetical protein
MDLGEVPVRAIDDPRKQKREAKRLEKEAKKARREKSRADNLAKHKPAGPPPQQSASAAARQLTVGLVGCGWYACRSHIPALLQLQKQTCGQNGGYTVRVGAVCSRTARSAERAARQFGADTVVCHATMEDMLADPRFVPSITCLGCLS